jgi:hypothetical protein
VSLIPQVLAQSAECPAGPQVRYLVAAVGEILAGHPAGRLNGADQRGRVADQLAELFLA